MAPRPFWKGYRKLSLVTCPVQMEPARTEEETISFHTINRKTGNRVESRYVDAETGKRVSDDDQVKRYSVAEDNHVMLEDEEPEAAWGTVSVHWRRRRPDRLFRCSRRGGQVALLGAGRRSGVRVSFPPPARLWASSSG